MGEWLKGLFIFQNTEIPNIKSIFCRDSIEDNWYQMHPIMIQFLLHFDQTRNVKAM